MSIFFNEKDIINLEELKNKGITLNKRDIIEEYDENLKKIIYKINFTGFEITNMGEIIYFFPYRYKPDSITEDGKLLFKTIYKHSQKRPELYFGKRAKDSFISNYPFAYFFEIFNYYIENGLYLEYNDLINKQQLGKLHWKNTISKSNKYIINNMIFFDTPYHINTSYSTNLITECMICILNNTFEKFNFIFENKKLKIIGSKFKYLNFIENKEFIIKQLTMINARTFNSKTKKLIVAIINFFNSINIGGSFYLKHYNFEIIWEDMIRKYLNNKFKGIVDEIIDLSGNSENNNFIKEKIYPNLLNTKHNIQPDYVLKKDNNIYLFDAKYYEPLGIDYKQLCYNLFFSKNISELKNIHSALIIPSNVRETKKFFLMNSEVNSDLKDLKINFEYLNIKNVMEEWI